MTSSLHTTQDALSHEYLRHKDKIDEAIGRVLKSGRYILGPELERFEKRFAELMGYEYCVGVGSGYDGLLISLLATKDTDIATIVNELHIATTNACIACGIRINREHNSTGKTYIIKGKCKIRDACREAHCFVKDDSDIAVFSFHPLKRLHCYGDGGAIVTDSSMIFKDLRQIRNHGRIDGTDIYEFGVNSRLDEIQAAVLNVMVDIVCVT